MRSTGPQTTVIDLLASEGWWGGAVADGSAMPFGARPLARDLARNAGYVDDANGGANQSAPLLLSSAGRVVWSEHPFHFAFDGGALTIDGDVIMLTASEASLRGAFHLASARFFPASGRIPARELFTGPQYNTWIEAPYAPTQEGVLSYARGLLDAGFPPGVLMVDDNWAPDYGDWRFDPSRFPDARGMVDELHALGFSVMLWIVPFVSADSAVFRTLRERGLLLRGGDGEVAIREWWNGFSAVLDLTDPAATGWLREQLDALVDGCGVDGFKFDAGDLRHYRDDDVSTSGVGRVAQCEAWARFGADYPFNEFRASWKMGGQPLAQRLHDKPPTWGASGLDSLIPEGIAQGLIGHAFICADMVGGGDLESFVPGEAVDQEQFVRYAQCAALFPMMQFSMSPARVLDQVHLDAVRAAVAARTALLPRILSLVDNAAATGEPVVRALAYHFPGLEHVTDQFLLGEDILVAPVLERGARTRRVVVPPGQWIGEHGEIVEEGVVEVAVTLESLPTFRRERGYASLADGAASASSSVAAQLDSNRSASAVGVPGAAV